MHRNHLEVLLKFVFCLVLSGAQDSAFMPNFQLISMLDHTLINKVLSAVSVTTTQSSKVLLGQQRQEWVLIFFSWGDIQTLLLDRGNLNQFIHLFSLVGFIELEVTIWNSFWPLIIFHPYWKIQKHYLFECCSILRYMYSLLLEFLADTS